MSTDPSLPPSADMNNQEMKAVTPLVRLLPHAVNTLPKHPALAPTISAQNHGEAPQDPDRLLKFAQTLLAEAVAFTDDYLPRKFKPKSTKSSPPATAKVELLEHVRCPRGNEETWFARRSTHLNQAEPGTATFAEMDAALRHEHSLHEMQYTPDVFDAHEVLSWDSELAGLDLRPPPSASSSTSTSTSTSTYTSSAPGRPPFTDISMRLYEMCHTLPTPLQPRVFTVLVATAKTGPDGFVVVQIPVNAKSVPAAFYSNGRNVTEGTSPEKRKELVIGLYTSIERGRYYRATGGGGGGGGPGETEWVMATASDARGLLPMWVQKMGTPGALVKDVGLFMRWVEAKR